MSINDYLSILSVGTVGGLGTALLVLAVSHLIGGIIYRLHNV